jgi:hypothetical protein
VLLESPNGKDHLKNTGEDGKIILKCILEKQEKRCGLDPSTQDRIQACA